ncbi:MAG: nitroreductase family protein [Candidatus Latescibacterota bacterium]|nr:MAG: nitroreductase family protein [Candidatus Latescibacterota bacterium]
MEGLMMNEAKRARTSHSIHELIATRWSPYGFDARPVSESDLRSLFEAARWAASSYNEQPWRFIVARKKDAAEFERMLACLVEGNQAWARRAPVLALAVARLHFSHNDKPNPAAQHDIGMATCSLQLQATALGLSVHPMIGILPQRAREEYTIPQGYEALTALALGYAAELDALDDTLRRRDEAVRLRKPLSELVFARTWKRTAAWVEDPTGESS